jgi:uncharacterized membrane protein
LLIGKVKVQKQTANRGFNNGRFFDLYKEDMNQSTGKYIILFGIIVVVIGLVVYLLGDKLNWFGRLPGDVRVEKGNTRIYFPIVTMLIVSILLTIIINVFKKFL